MASPSNTNNVALYRSRMITTLYGGRMGLDDDCMLVGPPALKKEVRSISTTIPNTAVSAPGVVRVLTSGSTQGPTQHTLAAPIIGVEVQLQMTSTSTGSQQFLCPTGASIVASSLGTTVALVNLLGPGGSITLVGVTTAQWAVRARDDLTSTGLARAISFTTST